MLLLGNGLLDELRNWLHPVLSWIQIKNFLLTGLITMAGAVGMRWAAQPPGAHLGRRLLGSTAAA
jgi:hypothetical protein